MLLCEAAPSPTPPLPPPAPDPHTALTRASTRAVASQIQVNKTKVWGISAPCPRSPLWGVYPGPILPSGVCIHTLLSPVGCVSVWYPPPTFQQQLELLQ